MASFFSLQPSQSSESNLSKFASGMPNLEHVGNNASYLDPSLGGSETLHSPFEDDPGNSFTSGAKGGSGNLMANTGDQSAVPSPGGTSLTTGVRTPTTLQSDGGSTLPSGPTTQQIQGLVNSTSGVIQKGLKDFGPTPTGQSAGGEQGISDRLRSGSISTDDYDYLKALSPADMDKFMASLGDGSALQTNGTLLGGGQDNALQGFDLGADIQLTDPTTGQPSGSFKWGQAFQGGSQLAGGATQLASGIINENNVQAIGGALQSVSGLTQLAKASPEILAELANWGLDKSFIDGISTVSGGAGALLGVYSGIKALQEGNIEQGTISTLSGLVSGYGALQQLSAQFPDMFGSALPTIGEAAYKAIESVSPSAAEGLKALMDPGTTSAAMSGVSIAGGIGAAVSAILGIIASETGNKELGIAAGALGMAVSATTTGVAIAGATSAIAASVATGAAISVSAGVGIGWAMAPVAVALLAFSIANMVNPGSAPDISDIWTGGKKDPYLTFNATLSANQGQQDLASRTFQAALPYVQSKEELGWLVYNYNNYIATTQQAPVSIGAFTTGSHGAPATGSDPYTIGNIPGSSGKEHGAKGSPWSANTAPLQAMVNELRANLPGNEVTAQSVGTTQYDNNINTRLWSQFLDREQNTPYYLPQALAPHIINQGMPGEFSTGAINPGLHNLSELAGYGSEAFEAALRYGQPGYDYAAAGMPEPGRYLGSYSPYWMQVTGQANPEYNNYQFGTPIDLAGRQYVQHVPTPEELWQAQYYQDFTSGGM